MSVIKNKRGVSRSQYLDTASELQEFTMNQCKKLYCTNNPATIVIANLLAQLSAEVHIYTKQANIDKLNELNPSMYYECLWKAYASLSGLVSQINVAYERFNFEERTKIAWMALIAEEENLLKDKLY